MPVTLNYPSTSTMLASSLNASYTAQGWPLSATQTVHGSVDVSTTVVSNLGYSGIGGANGEPTSGTVGTSNEYTWNLSYDGLARPTTEAVTLTSGGTTEFNQTRGYDSVGNVTSVNTTLPAGTDNQVYSLNILTLSCAILIVTVRIVISRGHTTMAQIAIPDALYQRLQVMAQQQQVALETIVQEALENISGISLLPSHEEQRLFDLLDQIAQKNGQIHSHDWGQLVSELRD